MPKLSENEDITSAIITSWDGMMVQEVLITRLNFTNKRVKRYLAENNLKASDRALSWPAVICLLTLVKEKRKY